MRIFIILILCLSTQVYATERWRFRMPPPPPPIAEVPDALLECNQQLLNKLSSLETETNDGVVLNEDELNQVVVCLKNGNAHMKLANLQNKSEEMFRQIYTREEVVKLKLARNLIRIRETALKIKDEELLGEIDEQLKFVLRTTEIKARYISLSDDYQFGLEKLKEYFNTAPLISDELKKSSASYFSALLKE